jgi:hypothetical protein
MRPLPAALSKKLCNCRLEHASRLVFVPAASMVAVGVIAVDVLVLAALTCKQVPFAMTAMRLFASVVL